MWKTIEGFANYQVSDDRKVRSLRRKRYDINNKIFVIEEKKVLLSPGKTTKGYLQVRLINGKATKYVHVHQLVLECFVALCPAGKQVNHKNGIKTDNRVDNLEYVFPKENMKHAFNNGLTDREYLWKKVAQCCEGEVVKVFDYVRQVEKYGFDSSSVSACCKGKRKIHKGYEWKYVEGQEVRR